MTQTARLGLPFLQPGQAQKELFHNEALQLLDLAVAAAVDGMLVDAPPASPAVGACYIVGPSPTGAWVGHAEALAGYGDGGWRFVAPVEGMAVFDKAGGGFATFIGGSWDVGSLRGDLLILDGVQVVGPQLAAVSNPTGGTIIDTESRSAIAAILTRLRAHGLIAS